MDSFTARGVILHSREYKEKDRLVSFLTSDRGLITVLAKGSAKLGSRNAYVSVPFMVCDFVITSSHGFYYLKDGSIVENNSSIMGNLEALTVASHLPIVSMTLRCRVTIPVKLMSLRFTLSIALHRIQLTTD